MDLLLFETTREKRNITIRYKHYNKFEEKKSLYTYTQHNKFIYILHLPNVIYINKLY